MSKHLKRLASPRKWPVPRKTSNWIVRPLPGPHSIEDGIPLLVGLKEFINIARTSTEARRIIGKGEILVDGRVTHQYKRSVGLMDVISIPKLKLNFRVLLDPKGKLRFINISNNEAKYKLVRIQNKTTVSGGKTQLNFHDGRNILLDKDKYKTGDVLKISVPEQKLLAHYPFEPGNMAMLIGGNHIGEFAVITEYVEVKSPKPNLVYFEGFSTIKDYAFVVGHDKPEISVPDINVLEETDTVDAETVTTAKSSKKAEDFTKDKEEKKE